MTQQARVGFIVEMDLTTALDGQLLRKPEDAACETKPDLKQKDASASKKRIVQMGE